ncbi:MAG: signal peptidase I, partial [Ruminiclostridium sp.]|nr:signal peptidase I [Ruminiclostridium sp.]
MLEHTSPEEIQEGKEHTEAPKEKPTLAADCYGWLQALTVALLILIVVFTFFGRIIGVDGSSMVPTLENGDMLLLQCVGYEPEQGDVVVLHKDFASITGPIVKRVIATGGQTVEID